MSRGLSQSVYHQTALATFLKTKRDAADHYELPPCTIDDEDLRRDWVKASGAPSCGAAGHGDTNIVDLKSRRRVEDV